MAPQCRALLGRVSPSDEPNVDGPVSHIRAVGAVSIANIKIRREFYGDDGGASAWVPAAFSSQSHIQYCSSGCPRGPSSRSTRAALSDWRFPSVSSGTRTANTADRQAVAPAKPTRSIAGTSKD